MAVATEDRTSFRQVGQTRRYDMVAGAETIYKGTLVNRDASGDAAPATDAASLELLGVATEQVVAATGDAAGDKKVKVWTTGFFEFVHSGLTQANVGDNAYVVDDTTVDLLANVTNSVFVGRIVDVPSATVVVVSIFVRGAGSAGGVAVIVDSSGGAASNNTIEVITAAAAITDNSGGTDPGDDTIAVVTNTQALTDSTTGAAGTTLAAGVGMYTVSLKVALATLTDADIVTDYIVGHKFKLIKMDFAVDTAVTTAAKASTLDIEIGAVAVTGGDVALTSANATPKGVVVAGTAISGANTGAAGATITILASATTTFIEGDGWITLQIQNMDAADAFATAAAELATQRTANIAILAAVAQLAAKLNTDSTGVTAARDGISELATKVNEIIAT